MNSLQQTEQDVLQQSQAWARAQREEQRQRQADEGAMVSPQTGERFSEATLILDFHHARDPLMAVGESLYGEDSAALHAWLDPLVEQLPKGQEARVIHPLEDLQQILTLGVGEAEGVDRETRYDQEHRDHIHDQRWKRSGAPRGSGAVESLGGQLQRRFRTCGQFWKRQGLTHLLRLSVLYKNQDADFLWN